MAVDVTQLVPYRIAVFDNARWAPFEPRPEDIFVCTPSKCGTTWTQTIVANLLWPNGDTPDSIMTLSPWIEAEFIPMDVMYAGLEAQTHRRFMKSHTPADGIPWFADARYVVVVRDGRDAYMSWVNHVQAMRAELKAGLSAQARQKGLAEFPDWNGDMHTFFRAWLDGASHVSHVASFWPRRTQPNVLLVHYNDLKADLAGEMRRIARFLGLTVPERAWPDVVARCTFEAMQASGKRIGDFDALFEGGASRFIFKGTNGRWRGVLSDEDLAEYERHVAEWLSRDAAAWMEFGRARLTGAANA